MAVTSAALLAGCSSGPSPQPQEPPSSTAPPANPSTGFTRVVSGAGDSVGAQPGSPSALYKYRFRQIDPPSDRFTLQDRDLSFYFKPTPDALHFQVENRQNRPVLIEWDRSIFYDPNGRSDRVAHGTTRWAERFTTQSSTQIPGLQ